MLHTRRISKPAPYECDLMKVLQVGLGSMGKRRIRCLRALGERDIIAYDTREDRRAEAVERYGVRIVERFEDGLNAGVETVIVSTPPDAHYPFVKEALDAGKHCFSEANIESEGAEELAMLAANRSVIAAPSATLRFHPLYQHLRRLVIDERVLGKPLLLDFHMGHYLPDWHPWEGLDFYAGRKATGACREMVPFEFQWMWWIFGPVESVQCAYGKQLDLAVDVDDAYAIIVRFTSGLLATVLIEVVARSPVRDGRLLSQSGSITWEFYANRLRYYDGASRRWREYDATAKGFDIEDMYVGETEAFLKACRGEALWTHSYADDRELGRILLACEQSSERGHRVTLKKVV